MLGKNSNQYRAWVEHAAELKNMPRDVELVNLGSTAGKFAFDYSLWHIDKDKGFSLAYQPQPLYYDFETLKKYRTHIAQGAKILIIIEEFKLILDAYPEKSSDDKYYLWLDIGQIRTGNKLTGFLVKNIPCLLHPRFILSEMKRFVLGKRDNSADSQGTQPVTAESDRKYSDMWYRCWKDEFHWDDSNILPNDARKNININYKRLLEMIDYCRELGFTPYIIIPPVSPNLTRLLPDAILTDCLFKPLKKAGREKSVKVMDLYHDERFMDYTIFGNALTLNDKGRRVFNSIVECEIFPDKQISIENNIRK